jgi:Domain of unknown function (DUF389)
MVVTLLFGLVIRWSGHTPELYLAGVRPVSDLIDSPNLFSVVVAVLAGIVGVVSLTEARASALIGVFISVTTIPAAADIALAVAYGSWSEARGAAFPVGAERDAADRGGGSGPAPPADHLACPRAPAAVPEWLADWVAGLTHPRAAG